MSEPDEGELADYYRKGYPLSSPEMLTMTVFVWGGFFLLVLLALWSLPRSGESLQTPRISLPEDNERLHLSR